MINAKNVHFIGIGGIGMSGLAEVFHCYGYSVKGSDTRETKVTNRLKAMGIDVLEGHSAENIRGSDMVVYSSCISEDNPEIVAARKNNIPILRRMEALNMLVGDKDIIAISGAHGKTTTTSLTALLLIEAGLDPTVFIGADVSFLNGNARYGQGKLVVTEADESDGSFLLLNPLYSVTTNMDKEHMDYYLTMDNVVNSYKRFIKNTKDEGCAFVCIEDGNLRRISGDSGKRILYYGLSEDADIRPDNIKLLGLNGSKFDVIFKNKKLGRVKLSIIGMHNIINSLASIGIAMDLGVDFSLIKKAISNFKGADRRFNVTHLDSDILIIDDYAHHPTEIIATLKAMERSHRRIVAVFQPHRYSRTQYLKEQFGRCFNLVNHLIITDIYSADEEPIEGVSGRDISESAKKYGHKNVHFLAKDDIIGHLLKVVKPKDAVFILGAGDIGELPAKIIKALKI